MLVLSAVLLSVDVHEAKIKTNLMGLPLGLRRR